MFGHRPRSVEVGRVAQHQIHRFERGGGLLGDDVRDVGEAARGAALGVLARGAEGPDFTNAALTTPNGFAGLDGIFRFNPDGLIQRGLAVLQVE